MQIYIFMITIEKLESTYKAYICTVPSNFPYEHKNPQSSNKSILIKISNILSNKSTTLSLRITS